ncbi:hypothetical protein C7999DRAFT_44916 [Corynascus novoguineensis]|uniref:Uncharacterized protein n=1 Tax=Corynascus novoguineensis TaxID=1126955 RepID=A0AAN7HKB3_9PEZI|nr:hypothetical protein C7999DRAFT_44916 [Corynascus novoguineensis]
MRRTGWLETFDGANRGFLVRLAQPPCLQSDGLRLSMPGDGADQPTIWSLYKDEVRLSRIALVLYGLQDRYSQDALLQLASFLVTEPFQDGQADSTLLVYFSGVAGLNLSALIYCVRLILLETTLLRFAYHSIRIPARPRHDQLTCLNKIRTRAFCLGS